MILDLLVKMVKNGKKSQYKRNGLHGETMSLCICVLVDVLNHFEITRTIWLSHSVRLTHKQTTYLLTEQKRKTHSSSVFLCETQYC